MGCICLRVVITARLQPFVIFYQALNWQAAPMQSLLWGLAMVALLGTGNPRIDQLWAYPGC